MRIEMPRTVQDKIPLSGGLLAKVDSSLFPELSKYNWYAVNKQGAFYACKNENLPHISENRQSIIKRPRLPRG